MTLTFVYTCGRSAEQHHVWKICSKTRRVVCCLDNSPICQLLFIYIYIESSKVISPLCCVSSLQPGGVQSEHLPHLRGPDQSPESGPVLCLWRCVCDRLELPGCDRNRALPNSTTVEFPQALKTGLCLREEA